ncbi:MAG: insulinase family protein [Betaproteobacteria bacterium]|nr:insulinase family protein [Betaproteobacteria bacterium]
MSTCISVSCDRPRLVARPGSPFAPHRWARRALVGLCAACLLPVAALAQAPRAPASPAAVSPPSSLPAGLSRVTSVEGITEYLLPNGLQLLLVPDDAKPTTTVNLTFRVGSRHENYGETGMAHLLEHMLFKGTPRNRKVWAEFTKRGLRANGTTSYDRTNYFASFAANDDNLRWYLSWQADAMVNSFIAREDLDTEMTVVRNEFESGENSPGRVLLEKTLATMYQWHNYGKSVIGARSDIENVDIPRLQAFYRQYYQPDNATLIVTGKFDVDRVRGWVTQYFGALPRPQRVLPTTYTLDPQQDGERQVTVRRVGGTPQVYMTYHVPAGSHPDFAAVQLLSMVLGDTPGGRLHKGLVEARLAAQAFASAWTLAEPGPLILGAGLAPGQDIDRARITMASIADGLTTEPVTAEELERARTAWLNAWDRAFTDPEEVGVSLSEAVANGDWRLYFLQRDQVRKLTLVDMHRVAGTWLKRDNRTVGIYLPATDLQRAPKGEKVDVAALVKDYRGDPGVAQAEAFDPTPATLDARTQVTRVGGLKVALLPKTTRGRVVQARLALRLGDEKSLFGQDSVASFTARLLDKGGAGLTRQQIADEFEKLQAEVAFGGSGQTLSVNINTRRERLPAVLLRVGRLLREPAFPAEPLEEARQQSLAAIERQRKEPDAIIANRLAHHGNPYPRGDLRHARSFDELEQDVKAVDIGKVKAFHRRFYSAAQGEFSAVGDMDAAAVRQALETAFGNWRAPADGVLPFVRIPQPLVAAPAQRFVATTPDKANANLRGRLSLPLSDRHPDHAALMTANFIFGLGGNSRLWTRIRETDGLSYDVRSVLSWSAIDDNTGWEVSAIFAPQNQSRVEAAFREELARSLQDGFTQQELDEGRNALLNFRRLSRAQDDAVAGALVNNLYLDRRFAFAQQVDDAIARLTVEQINAAWRKYIDPARLTLAWGGDFKAP